MIAPISLRMLKMWAQERGLSLQLGCAGHVMCPKKVLFQHLPLHLRAGALSPDG